MSALTFDEVQERASEWVSRNFPDKMPLDAALVAAEEASEAAAAMTRMLVKQRQGIRGNEDFEARVLTEYADTLIAFADWCSTRGWTLQDVIANRLDEVTAREWRALSSEDATRPTGDNKSGPEDGQSDTAPMKRPVMEGVDPAATDSGHVGASTYVWLIERGQAEHQEPTAWVTKAGPIAWTTNAYAAIRFQTREAAQAFIAEHLTHPTRGPSARAVQHGFARPTGDKE